MTKRILPALVLCLAASPAFSAEPAIRNEIVEPARLLSAFADICLKNLGNPTTQLSVAEATPFSMAKRASSGGELRLRSKAFGLGVRDDGSHSCAVTSETTPHSTLETFKALFIKEFSANDGKPMPSPDSRYWLVEIGGSKQPYAITLKVSNASGSNLATFMISKAEVQK